MVKSIIKQFLKTLDKNPDFTIIKVKDKNKWINITRNSLYSRILGCKQKLINKNVKVGERIVYKGCNSIDWISWNLACQSIGGVWVPMYQDQTQQQCQYIVNDCDAKLLITSEDISIKNTSIIKPNSYICENNTIVFNNNIIDNELSTLIYTSGTTGKPKGVMLSHNNISSNLEDIRCRFNDIESGLTSLNVLPWAHIYGLTCELYYNLLYDNTTAICSDKSKFIDECSEIRPNIIYVVPKILEAIKSKVEFLDKPLIKLVLPKLINRILGNNINNIFIGGAKLDKTTKLFYENNGIIVCEGYGCSETSPMISVNHLYYPRDIESVGRVLDNVLLQIIDNEICVSGPNIMQGYWNYPEETDKVLFKKDNKTWYRTGDEGYIKDGYLYYQGRISENYKMSNGKFVNVATIESLIKPYIKTHFIIYGENMDYNVLIVETPFNNNTLETINSELDNYMKIKKIIIITSEEMNQFLTPKMSIKRKNLINYVKDKF